MRALRQIWGDLKSWLQAYFQPVWDQSQPPSQVGHLTKSSSIAISHLFLLYSQNQPILSSLEYLNSDPDRIQASWWYLKSAFTIRLTSLLRLDKLQCRVSSFELPMARMSTAASQKEYDHSSSTGFRTVSTTTLLPPPFFSSGLFKDLHSAILSSSPSFTVQITPLTTSSNRAMLLLSSSNENSERWRRLQLRGLQMRRLRKHWLQDSLCLSAWDLVSKIESLWTSASAMFSRISWHCELSPVGGDFEHYCWHPQIGYFLEEGHRHTAVQCDGGIQAWSRA